MQRRAADGDSLPLRPRLPIQHHRKVYGSALRYRHSDEKASAICCDIAANKTKRQLEQRLRRSRLKCWLGADLDRHEVPVGSFIEQLFAIPAPSGIGSTPLGDEPLAPGIPRSLSRAGGEFPDVNFIAAGLVRCVCDPTPIARKLASAFVELGAQEWDRLAISLQWEHPQVAFGLWIFHGI